MFFMNFAKIIGPEGDILKIMYYEKLPYLVMLIMLISGCLFSFITHRHPLLQSRVCMLTGLILVGFQIWLAVDFLAYRKEMIFSVTMLFPMVSATLEIIAARKALVDGVTMQAAKYLKNRKKSR
jgi:hypothetical protein